MCAAPRCEAARKATGTIGQLGSAACAILRGFAHPRARTDIRSRTPPSRTPCMRRIGCPQPAKPCACWAGTGPAHACWGCGAASRCCCNMSDNRPSPRAQLAACRVCVPGHTPLMLAAGTAQSAHAICLIEVTVGCGARARARALARTPTRARSGFVLARRRMCSDKLPAAPGHAQARTRTPRPSLRDSACRNGAVPTGPGGSDRSARARARGPDVVAGGCRRARVWTSSTRSTARRRCTCRSPPVPSRRRARCSQRVS